MDFFQQIDNIALLEPAAHFELFRSISNALNSKDSGIQAVGRNHLIKVIDVWEDVPSTLKPMWEDLIEAVGFYPYIEKYKMTLTDLDARIRQEYHRSEYIFDKTLHSKQKDITFFSGSALRCPNNYFVLIKISFQLDSSFVE